VIAFGALWWNPSTRSLAWRISDENQPIELLTFLLLFAAGLLGFDLVRRLRARGASWRELPPESIRWRNRQGEMNLHNIGPMHGKSSVLRLAFAVGGGIGFWLRRTPLIRGVDPPIAILPWLAVVGACAGVEALIDIGAVAWSEDAANLFQNVMPEVTELLIGVAALLYIWINRRRFASSDPNRETNAR
jgi:hypothetical protein